MEEYGVHWNFFFTLALVKILSGLLFTISPPTSSLLLSFLIGGAYEAFLTQTGFQSDYLLNSSFPRSLNLIAANREGLFSSIGYFSIYLSSIYVGQLIYRNLRVRESIGDWLIYSAQSGSQVGLLWLFTYLSHTMGNPCSRRAANLSYILWALATNYTVLWLHLTFNLLQFICQELGLLHGPLIHYYLRLKEEAAGRTELEDFLAREEAERQELRTQARLEKQAEDALELLEGKVEVLAEKLREKETNPLDLEAFSQQVEIELSRIEEKCQPEMGLATPSTETPKRKYLVQLPDLTNSPITLTAICYNGLFVFLIGNLLTGAVNSLVYSIYTPDTVALLILWAYASLITLLTLTLYWFKIQLKFW